MMRLNSKTRKRFPVLCAGEFGINEEGLMLASPRTPLFVTAHAQIIVSTVNLLTELY